ncbi:MAG: hypothetical protein H7Z18_03900 [Methylophilaceae bacterium]|nr:hypothetical protein [Methylophilaceae bacterium]
MQKALKILIILIILAAVLSGLYTWAMLSWSYSSGERAGLVQKISQKGWICKTWEGELIMVSMPGTQAEKFYFTVRNADLAKRITDAAGTRVKLVYEEHIGLPSSCFGDTNYYIKDILPLAAAQ